VGNKYGMQARANHNSSLAEHKPSLTLPTPLPLPRSTSRYVFQVPPEGDDNLAYNDVEGQGVPGRVFNTNLRSPDVEYEPPTYEGDMSSGNGQEEGGKMPHVAEAK